VQVERVDTSRVQQDPKMGMGLVKMINPNPAVPDPRLGPGETLHRIHAAEERISSLVREIVLPANFPTPTPRILSF
jgi:hypothetical protein